MYFHHVKISPSITNSHTAVIVFARSGALDSRSKKLNHAEALFNELTDHTVNVVRQTGLPYFVIDESKQRGKSFGERYASAINDILKLGFKNVITVGNDTPHLNADHIQTAAKNLNDNFCTVGPSNDGGYYLLGITDIAFKKATQKGLAGIEWQSQNTLDCLLSLLSLKSDNIQILEYLSDLDDLKDVKSLIENPSFLPCSILQLLKLLLSENKIHLQERTQVYDGFLFSLPYNKGSPSFF